MALGALECRVVAERAGFVRLDVVWSDPLATPVPALPVNIGVDLAAVPVGVRENGKAWTLRLLANHLLVAGVTGAGKSSVLWSIIRAIAPAVHAGTVQLWGVDPKGGMEFRPARPLFTRFADGTLEEIAKMLEDLVVVLDARADRYADAGVRTHVPTTDEPLIVLVVDELAFLTAYCPDRKMRDRINLALATLLSKGRGPGVCVIGALQDPRKEVIGYRNLSRPRSPYGWTRSPRWTWSLATVPVTPVPAVTASQRRHRASRM
jgi:S-DNA-T family DNA segregation ATPase FtsK/SpoIIIE